MSIVQVSTFLQWPTGDIIGYKSKKSALGKETIDKHSDKLVASLHGQAVIGFQKYVTGT